MKIFISMGQQYSDFSPPFPQFLFSLPRKCAYL